MKKYLLLLLIPLVLSCGSKSAKEPVAVAKIGQSAPDFELRTINGKKIKLSNYKGKVVLLDFWATWCGPCRMSTPVLSRLDQKYKGKGLVILGVSLDEDESQVLPYVEKNHIEHTIAYGGTSNVGNIYKVRGIPAFFIIDQAGMIQKNFTGFHPDFETEWINQIDQLLAKK